MISKERERIDRRLEAEMRARRERGELRRRQAQEIAKRDGYEWNELNSHDRDLFLQQAREGIRT
jgi:hypothetical protein